jgi:hypothetical protein
MGSTIGNLGNKNVMDPNQAQWGDLDSSEKGARLIGGAGKGLLQGVQNYSQQNAALRQPTGGAPMQMPGGAQPVDPSYFAPSPNPFQQPQRRGANMLNFYGQG